MKKLLTTASATLLLAGLASQAQAFDGTITFTGNISAQTCTVGAAGSTTNGTVTLPTISTKALSAANDTAAATQFSIKLSACSGTATQAAAWFESGTNVDPASGRLKNTGTATGVDVALYNTTSNTPIAIGQGDGSIGSSGAAFPITAGAATMYYQARYYATAPVTTGTISASVNYTIQYQ